MLHARTDYDRIQDPAASDPSLLSEGSSPIGEDEPVFLIRAKDITSPLVVDYWARLHKSYGGSAQIAEHVTAWAQRMREWQEKNGRKVADVPDGCLRIDRAEGEQQ